jgi:hypothetical protein
MGLSSFAALNRLGRVDSGLINESSTPAEMRRQVLWLDWYVKARSRVIEPAGEKIASSSSFDRPAYHRQHNNYSHTLQRFQPAAIFYFAAFSYAHLDRSVNHTFRTQRFSILNSVTRPQSPFFG